MRQACCSDKECCQASHCQGMVTYDLASWLQGAWLNKERPSSMTPTHKSFPLYPPLYCYAAGRADIQTGQQVLQGKLDLLLQRQQAAIDAMNAANSQLAALQVRTGLLFVDLPSSSSSSNSFGHRFISVLRRILTKAMRQTFRTACLT